MGIFDNLFKGKHKETKDIDDQIKGFQIPVFSDFSFMPMSEDELNSLKKYSETILGYMHLNGLKLNEEHSFHPDNLLQFWEVWSNKEESLRFPPVKSTLFLDYLASSLGMYLQEKLNMDWCYAANMKNPINGNVVAEVTLRFKNSNIFIQPKVVLNATIENTVDILNREIKRIENEISKYKSDSKDYTFEEFVANAKINGSGADVVSIWDYVLKLKEWHFISVYEDDVQKCRPFIGVVNNRPWFFMFTSREKAQAYSKTDSKFLGKNGESYVISQTVEHALEMIFKSESQGVFGLMVNENDSTINSNFNVPIEVLRNIIQSIKGNK